MVKDHIVTNLLTLQAGLLWTRMHGTCVSRQSSQVGECGARENSQRQSVTAWFLPLRTESVQLHPDVIPLSIISPSQKDYAWNL